MVEGKSRSGSVAVGVMKALHHLNAENHPTTLNAICDWLAASEDFYYDDWLIVAGRSAQEYIGDILEDLRDLGVVCIVVPRAGIDQQMCTEWRLRLQPSA
jgi:hypothetical protein